MKKLDVFDPPMCCSTGVCGPTVDPALPRFVADLHWLANHGIAVTRYNLGQEPQAFAANPIVKAALSEGGTDCLPLLLIDGHIVSQGVYPDRSRLAELAGIDPAKAQAGLSLPVL